MTEQIEKLFGETVLIKVADSRVIEGQLQALDKDMNIGTYIINKRDVITSFIQYWVQQVNIIELMKVINNFLFYAILILLKVNLEGDLPSMTRSIGMAIIPGNKIVSVSLKKV